MKKSLNRIGLLGIGLLTLSATVGCGTGLAPSAAGDAGQLVSDPTNALTLDEIIENGRVVTVSLTEAGRSYYFRDEKGISKVRSFQNGVEVAVVDTSTSFCIALWNTGSDDNLVVGLVNHPYGDRDYTFRNSEVALFAPDTLNSFYLNCQKVTTLEDVRTTIGEALVINVR